MPVGVGRVACSFPLAFESQEGHFRASHSPQPELQWSLWIVWISQMWGERPPIQIIVKFIKVLFCNFVDTNCLPLKLGLKRSALDIGEIRDFIVGEQGLSKWGI